MRKKGIYSVLIIVTILVCSLSLTPSKASAANNAVVPINWSLFTAGLPTDAASVRVGNILNNANKYALTTWYNTVKNFDAQTGTYLSFGGVNEENIRPSTTEAFSLAVSIKLGVYDPAKTGVSVQTAKDIAVKLVTSLAYRHLANTSGGWGNNWQSTAYAGEIGFTGWLLWDDLTAVDQEYIRKVVVYEANRMIGYQVPYYKTPSGTITYPGDSKAEENSWNSMGLAIATAMMPNHANYDAWQYKMLELMVSAYSSPANVADPTSLKNGRALSDWLYGSNVNPDGTVINHGILHPDYMTSLTSSVFGSLTRSITRASTPEVTFNNFDNVFDSLVDLNFTAGTAYPPGPNIFSPGGTIYVDNTANIYYPQGNDWGTSRKMNFAVMDIQAHAYNFDTLVAQKGDYWENYHAQAALDMQNRSTDGRTYIAAGEDTYSGREEAIADLAGNAYFTKWVIQQGAFSKNTINYPIVIDNKDREFQSDTGPWLTYLNDADMLGTDISYVAAGTGTKTAKYRPRITQAGNYKVYAWWTAAPNHATNAEYAITHNGTTDTVYKDQKVNGGQWNLLGTYYFTAGSNGYVRVSDNANGYMVADGMKFEYVPSTSLYSNDFESGTAAGWTTTGGTWSVVTDGTKVYNQSNTTAPGITSYTGQSTWQDYTISAKVKADAFDSGNFAGIGLVARRVDSNNYYFFMYYKLTNTLKISKVVGGVSSDIITTPYTLSTGTWYDFKAVVNGSTLEFWVDGIKKLTTTDTSIGAGQIGVYSHRANVKFDNINVY